MPNVTLNSWINDKKNEDISMKNHFYKGVLTNDTTRLYVLEDSVLIPYDEELNKYKKTYTMNYAEFHKYRYNPWRLAKDIYGSTEYWFLILHANEMYSASEFDKERITLYTSDVLKVINEILAVEDVNIKRNISEVNKYMKGVPSKLDLI